MIPLPDKKYQIIYADPPWQYRDTAEYAKFRPHGMGAEHHYPVMPLDEICGLPIQDITDKNCVLFLWGTVPLLPESLKVMDAWGFKYKTSFYWRKIMCMGTGHWFRGQVEFMLLGIKGKILAFHNQSPNFFQSHVQKHSKKPKYIRGLINTISEQYNLNPKIELFSRDKIEGWNCWGNEVPTSEQKLLKPEWF